jgi:hypothetical protein
MWICLLEKWKKWRKYKMKTWHKSLISFKPCEDGKIWALTHNTKQEAWDDCQRGDWMLWYLGKICKSDAQRKRLVLAACACARLALSHLPKKENRPLRAIEAAESWARDDNSITIEHVRSAANAAFAAYAAYAANAAYAAYAATQKTCADIVRLRFPKPRY